MPKSANLCTFAPILRYPVRILHSPVFTPGDFASQWRRKGVAKQLVRELLQRLDVLYVYWYRQLQCIPAADRR